MHRLILGLSIKDGIFTDHINGNILDNRRANLRTCTNSQNQANSKLRKDNTSGYKGVNFIPKTKNWQASIRLKGKKLYLGHFVNKELAARAYNSAAKLYFGKFAKLNPE